MAIHEQTLARLKLPGRNEFGSDHIRYIGGQRHRVGFTRTIRPDDGELGGGFRSRVHQLALELLNSGCEVEVLEELKAGAVVQCVVTATHAPEPFPIEDALLDTRTAGGRPTSWPRGSRGHN